MLLFLPLRLNTPDEACSDHAYRCYTDVEVGLPYLLGNLSELHLKNISLMICLQVILAPSPKYTGMIDDPPRYMGEGFVVLSSNNVELYYYMDEPGNILPMLL